MRIFQVYTEVLGTWFEGRKRLDGVIDLEPSPNFSADSPGHALCVAKALGYKNPIIGEVTLAANSIN